MNQYDDGRLLPAAGTPERLAYTYWLHYAEGTFMPLMILSLVMNRIETAAMPFFIKPMAKGIAAKVRNNYLDRNVKLNLDYMDAALAKSTWFCGDQMTAADIQMSFAVEAAEVRAVLPPNLDTYLKRIRVMPAYQAALEKGGPYKLMGKDWQLHQCGRLLALRERDPEFSARVPVYHINFAVHGEGKLVNYGKPDARANSFSCQLAF